MLKKYLTNFRVSTILLLVIMTLVACQGGDGSPIETSANLPTTAPLMEFTPGATTIVEEIQPDVKPIDNLQDIREGLIWIESTGPFYDFEYGQVQNQFGRGVGYAWPDPSPFVVPPGGRPSLGSGNGKNWPGSWSETSGIGPALDRAARRYAR